MADQLTATPGTGSQTATQSPQTAGQGSAGGTKSSAVQPGTASALLNKGQGGVSLNQQSLTTVNLAPAATAQTTASAKPEPAPVSNHHVQPALLAIPVVMVLAAIVLFWLTNRSVKNTT